MSDLCIQCRRPVTTRQHAVTCDRCEQWQHRTCDTGITIYQYRQAVRCNTQIQFVCRPCQQPTNTQNGQTFDNSLPAQEPVLLREVHTPEMPTVQCHDQDDQSMLNLSFDIPRRKLVYPSAPNKSPNQTLVEPVLPRDVTTPVLPPKPSTTNDDPIGPLPSRSDDLDASLAVSSTKRINVSFSSDSDSDLSDFDIVPDVPVTYKVLERGSRRGGPLLVSSDGYSYTTKKVNKKSTNWRCSVRSNTLTCFATVRQVGESFERGFCNHLHPSDVTLPMRVELRNKFRETAANHGQDGKSTRDVVQAAIHEVDGRRRWLLPRFNTMFRAVNRYRAANKKQ